MGLVRFLFVFIMILMVSIASNLGCQKLSPMLDDNLVTTKFMSSQSIFSLYRYKLNPIMDENTVIAKVIVFMPISNIDYQKINLLTMR